MLRKVLLLIVICWLVIGAIDFLFLFNTKLGKQRVEQMSTYDFLGIMLVTIITGPVPIISAFCRYFRNRAKEK